MACCRQPTHLQPNDRLRLIAPRSAGRSSCRIATQAMANGLKQRFPFVEAIVRGTSTLDLAWTGAGEPTVGEMEPGRDMPSVGDLAELGENLANHRQWLNRFAELVGGEVLFPVPAYGVDLAAPFPVTRGGAEGFFGGLGCRSWICWAVNHWVSAKRQAIVLRRAVRSRTSASDGGVTSITSRAIWSALSSSWLRPSRSSNETTRARPSWNSRGATGSVTGSASELVRTVCRLNRCGGAVGASSRVFATCVMAASICLLCLHNKS